MKRELSDLAIFGGQPEFTHPLHVGRPLIGDRSALFGRLGDALDRRWLSNEGRLVKEFEERIAEHLEVEHCVAVSSGTTALQIVAKAAGVRGTALMPSFTFVATPNALHWQGVSPLFCDVISDTHNLDPEAARPLLGGEVTAIIGVHLWGRPCEPDDLQALANEHSIPLIFDAAHAFSCSHKGCMIGGFGAAEVFSFHATKFLNAGEGGAITTNDGALADEARLMRNFGFTGYDRSALAGINGKMSELTAAMGLTSLDSLPAFADSNFEVFSAYEEALRDLPGIALIRPKEGERHNHHHVVVEVDAEEAGVSRDALYRTLWEENILARRYFHPGAHRMEPYLSTMPNVGDRLPATEFLSNRTLALPSGGEMDSHRALQVSEVLRFLISAGREFEQRLTAAAGLG